MNNNLFFDNQWECVEKLIEDNGVTLFKVKRVNHDYLDEYSIIKSIEIKGRDVHSYLKQIDVMQRLKASSNFMGIDDYEVIRNRKSNTTTIHIRFEDCSYFATYLKSHKLTNKEILSLGYDLTSAVMAAKEVSISNFPINFSNIFVSKFGNYKIDLSTSFSNSNIVSEKEIGVVLYKLFNNGFMDESYQNNQINNRFRRMVMDEKPCYASDDIFNIIKKYLEQDGDISSLRNQLNQLIRTISEEEIPFGRDEKTLDVFYKTVKFSDIEWTPFVNRMNEKMEISSSNENSDKEERPIEEPDSMESSDLSPDENSDKKEEPIASKIDDSDGNENPDLYNQTTIIHKKNDLTSEENTSDFNKTTVIRKNNVDTNQDLTDDYNKTTVIRKNQETSHDEKSTYHVEDEKTVEQHQIKPLPKKKSKSGFIALIVGCSCGFIFLFFICVLLLVVSLNRVPVSNYVNQNGTIALEELNDLGLHHQIQYEVVGEGEVGKVIRQDVKNRKVKKDSTISITIGISKEQAKVPEVVGLSRNDAVIQLEMAGFQVYVDEEYNDSVNKNTVISQMTNPNEFLYKGSVVEILVSKGKK